MTIKIKTPKGYYDLPEDYTMEVENTSPIYNERGSMTIAASLPATKHNLSLINNAHREDVALKPTKDMMVEIIDGVYRRKGKQNISSPSLKDGIQSTIGFDESLMYEAWSNVSLKKLPGLPLYQPTGGVTKVMEHLTRVMKYQEDADYYVFPIVVRQEEYNNAQYPVFINPIEITEEGNPPLYNLKQASRSENTIISGELMNITVPAGYGISPFLKVSKVLELIVSAFGYKLSDTPFHTHYQLKKMVILNNTADTIVEGCIDYADLMPDCTINDFLDSLFCRTGARIFVNGDTKTVRIELIKDSITSSATADWTFKKTTTLVPSYTAPKQIKLSASTSFEGAAPATDNFDDFYKKYSGIIPSVSGQDYNSVHAYYFLFYHVPTGTYYRNNLLNNVKEKISSDFFPWDKKDAEIEYEEITGADECVPMSFIDGLLCPQYLAGTKHCHTSLRIAAVSEKEAEDKTPLAFCFALGQAQSKKDNVIIDKGYFFGSTLCRQEHGGYFQDYEGNTYLYSLLFHGVDGAFNHFFKEWDAVLRHADNSYQGEFLLDKTTLSSLDISKPIKISGQKMMIDKIKFSLPIKAQPTSVTLRSLKLLQPFNLAVEQLIPTIKEQVTKWVLISFADKVFEQRKLELQKLHGKSLGYVVWEILSAPQNDEFASFLPPTELDVQAQKKILNLYKGKITYTVARNPGQTHHSEELNYEAGIRAEMV